MISGTLRLLLVATFFTPGLSFAQWEIAQLMEALKRTEPVQLGYTETRYLAYLKVPLVARGVLGFHPPDALRRTDDRRLESYLIKGDEVRIETAEGAREIALDTHPALRAFAESLRACLAGDLPRLQQYFLLQVQGDQERWKLLLKPRQASVAALIQRIELAGSGEAILHLEMLEAGGDRTLTELEAVP